MMIVMSRGNLIKEEAIENVGRNFKDPGLKISCQCKE
jgi:hypothetical protein